MLKKDLIHIDFMNEMLFKGALLPYFLFNAYRFLTEPFFVRRSKRKLKIALAMNYSRIVIKNSFPQRKKYRNRTSLLIMPFYR